MWLLDDAVTLGKSTSTKLCLTVQISLTEMCLV